MSYFKLVCWILCGVLFLGSLSTNGDEWSLERPTQVVLWPLREAAISSKVNGTIREYKISMGGRFKANEPLMLIDDAEFLIEVERSQAMLDDAQTQYDFTKERYLSQKKLYDQKFQSRSEVEKFKAEMDAADVKKRIAQANLSFAKLQLSYCKISLPFDGRVESILKREYETIVPGMALFQVIDDSKLYAVINLDIAISVKIDDELHFKFKHHEEQYTGRVAEISPRADARSGTREVRVLIDNSSGNLQAGWTGELILNGQK